MKRNKEREKLIAECLKIGHKSDNIMYMDWNSVDWHLKDRGLPKIFKADTTLEGAFGFLTIGGCKYEYFVVKNKVTVKQLNTGESNGIPSSTSAS